MDSNDQRIERLPARLTSLIAEIDELKGRWFASSKLSPQLLDNLRKSTLITSTGASTRIEGAKMTDEQVEAYLLNLKIKQFSERDTQEVQGYYETLELVFASYQEIKMSENTIKDLHSRLLGYSDKDSHHRGQYKQLDNKLEMFDASGQSMAVLFETTAVWLTPKAMAELVNWYLAAATAKRYHPLLMMANLVVCFLKIHPFLDGNGRLSRVLTNYLLVANGYDYAPYVSHEKLIESTKADYYRALRRSQASFGSNKESIEAWSEYFLRILLTQAQQANQLLSAQKLEASLSPKQLLVWRYLQTVTEASPGQISQATGVARSTVAQAISKLLGLNQLERLGQGRATRYRLKTS